MVAAVGVTGGPGGGADSAPAARGAWAFAGELFCPDKAELLCAATTTLQSRALCPGPGECPA